MDQQYRLYRRSNGVYYVENTITHKQESLRTKDRDLARQQWQARNQSASNAHVGVTLAKAYLASKSPELAMRTWQDVMDEMERNYVGSSLARFQRFMKSAPVQSLRKLPLMNTESSDFLKALHHPRSGTSTNKWLRIVHCRAIDLGWLLVPVLTRRAWPSYRYKKSRAVTEEQHRQLVSTSEDQEFAHYLEMLWETGGSQSDIANLHRNNIQLADRRIVYRRQKLASRDKGVAALVIGDNLLRLLDKLPQTGLLFPQLAPMVCEKRAARFRSLCHRLGLKGITLHSYRYSWAQRAKEAGMPMREAMAHLGHRSSVVHFAYAEDAEIVTLPLEFYQKQRANKMIAFVHDVSGADIEKVEHVA